MALFIDPQLNGGPETVIEILTQYFFYLGILQVKFHQYRFKVLQVGSSILNLLLMVLRIPLDLSLDAGHKGDGFSKALLKKSLEFILSRRDSTIIFNLGLVLLLVKVNSILEKCNRKEDVWKLMALPMLT